MQRRARIEIKTVQSGYFRGFNLPITLVPLALITFMAAALSLPPNSSHTVFARPRELTLGTFFDWYTSLFERSW
ncbi:MAG: hypothetical protein AAGI09_11095 [Pseudomonadota bacterium]